MRWSKPFVYAAGAAVGALYASTAQAKYFFNFQPPVTPIAQDFLFIHDLFLAIITAIFLLAFGVLLYSLYNHRKSRNAKPATFSAPTTRKLWILSFIPILSLMFIDYVVLGIPSFNSVLAVTNTSHHKLTVVVTASQWKWHYAYPAYGIQYTSSLSTPTDQIYGDARKDKHFLLEVDHPMVLPTNEKVLIVLKSADVIHGFWVPAFGVKMDAIPGYIRKLWVNVEKPGVSRGQCSELCGVGHGFMPIVVRAESSAGFTKWVASERAREAATQEAAEKTWSKAALIDRGKQVFDKNCAACHQPSGLGIPGAFPPIAWGHPFSATPAMLADLKALGFFRDGKIVGGPVKNHIHIVLDGIPGTPMPAFASQLGDADIASVITFERNAFGNNSGDIVQPEQITTARPKSTKHPK